MRRLIAYCIDVVLAGFLTSLFVEQSGLDLNSWPAIAIGFIVLLTVVPAHRDGATPGLFIVGLRIASIDGKELQTYQLLLRAAILVLLLPLTIFIVDFIVSYLFQINTGNIAAWVAVFAWVSLNLPPFVTSFGRMGFHDCISNTCVIGKSKNPALSTKPKYIKGLVAVAIGIAILGSMGLKIYWSSIVSSPLVAQIAANVQAAEDKGFNYEISSADLIDGLDQPFRVYADLHAFIGFSSIDEYIDELSRRNLLGLLAQNTKVPTYTVLLTTSGQLSIRVQDVIVSNLVRRIREAGNNACVVEFVSRTNVPGGYMFRVTRRVLAADIPTRTAGGSVVISIPPKSGSVQFMDAGMSEEVIRLTRGTGA